MGNDRCRASETLRKTYESHGLVGTRNARCHRPERRAKHDGTKRLVGVKFDRGLRETRNGRRRVQALRVTRVFFARPRKRSFFFFF